MRVAVITHLRLRSGVNYIDHDRMTRVDSTCFFLWWWWWWRSSSFWNSWEQRLPSKSPIDRFIIVDYWRVEQDWVEFNSVYDSSGPRSV